MNSKSPCVSGTLDRPYTDPMTETTRRFRVKTIPHRHHAAGKRKIRQRLDRPVTAPRPDPVFTAPNIHYEAAARTQAIACGGRGGLLYQRRMSSSRQRKLHSVCVSTEALSSCGTDLPPAA